MTKKWTNDAALVNSLAGELVEMLPLLPKRLVRIDALVRDHNMPFSQVQILVLLADGPLSVGDISAKLNIAKPNITPLVDSMYKAGLVERLRDADDHRIVNVRLLPAGEEKVQMLQQDVAAQIIGWSGEYSRSEIKELNHALATVLRFARGTAKVE